MEVNVSVAVRVRPPPPATTPDRLGDRVNVSLGPFPNCVTVNNIRPFQFDHVLPMDCSQSQLFENTVEPLVPYLLEGYDTTIVAYGQAGSGKSYTILGPGPHCALSETEYGIVPRATREVFNRMRLYPERRFRIYVTFVEIYQEVLRDLLNPNAVNNNLHIKEDPCVGMKIEGAEHVECQSIIEVFNCLLTGMNNRRQGERAHTIFSLLVEQQILSSDQSVQHKVSQLLLVDLAGSERLCSEGSVRLDSSLAALGNLVHALATQQSYLTSLSSPQQSHLPYRDSKLTHLLKSSLGGRAICLFVCCISSMASDMTDTLNTLSCGNLVKVVRNRPTMNHFVGPVSASLFDENRSHSNPASFADNMFGMEFVMLQWKKLVSDAEGLFHQITEGQGLTVEDLEHIQRWLCLKQECEEIVASQQADSLGQLLHRSLDVIGELSESEEKASDIDAREVGSDAEGEREEDEEDVEAEGDEQELDEEEKNDSFSGSPVKSYVSNNQSDVELEAKRISTPEFVSNIDTLIEEFKLKTDLVIQKIQDNESNDLQQLQSKGQNCTIISQPSTSGVEMHRLVTRRNSIRPDTNAAQMPVAEPHSSNANIIMDEDGWNSNNNFDPQLKTAVMLHVPKSPQISSELVEHSEVLTPENRQNQMKHVLLDLQGISAKINELQHTIQLKEEMLQDLVKNREVRLAAKQRLERKLRKTQDAYKNSQLKLAQVEKMIQHQKYPNSKLNEDLEKFRHAVQTYRQRLKDIASIQHLAEDSAEKAIDLEHSLTASRRQLEKLKRQLRKEERLKISVEKELHKEELALKQSDHPKISKENISHSSHKDDLSQSQTSSETSKGRPVDHSAIFKNGINPRSLHDTREGTAMRKAIRKLRKTKDCLIDQRCEINKKFRSEKVLTPEEERKLLELEEAIEAIDAAIEHKNEILCGRPDDLSRSHKGKDKGEVLLMERLIGLSLAETKMLLYKYFHKVIDLRDSSRKLELQVAEHETQAELQTWRFQALSHALQQARYATERQLVTQQRDHEEQLHLLLRHCAEESSCSGAEGSSTAITPRHDIELRRENKILRRKLEEAQITVHTGTSGRKVDPNLGALAIPEMNLRKLQATSVVPTTTKITREKNKLVIQQHKRRKSP